MASEERRVLIAVDGSGGYSEMAFDCSPVDL